MPALPAYDKAALGRILRLQYGVIARDQAVACGLTRDMIAYRVRRDGPWRRLLPATYAAATGTPTSDQRSMAALLYAGPVSVITGALAIRQHGLDCAVTGAVDILVPGKCQRKSTSFVRIRRTARMPVDKFIRGGLRFTPLSRAIGDTVRAMSHLNDVETLVCRAIQRGNCSLTDLERELADGPASGSRLFREAIRGAKAGIWSTAEGDLLRLIERSGIERPLCNPMLYTLDGSTFLGCPDMWWPRAGVAAQVDSRQYHQEALGYAKTLKDHNRMAKAGINVLHWLPWSIRNEERTVIAELRDALREGKSRPPLHVVTMPSAPMRSM
jgi:hypothetical protein